MKEKKTIESLIKKANAKFEKDGSGITADFAGSTAIIEIEWGDWKHDHAYADQVMGSCGFKFIGEMVTNENGSDCYSSIHYYKMK